VHGLHGRLELVAAEHACGMRSTQVVVGTGDEVAIPERGVLGGERYEAAVGVEAGGATGERQLDEGGEAARLGVVGHELGEHLGQVQGLRRQGALARAGGPLDDVRRVHGGEHGIHAVAQLGAVGEAEGDVVVADAALGPHQAGGHGAVRDDIAAADLLGGEAQHGVEHERGAVAGGDGGVRADEHQLEAAVG
jgi:hypothetical protein